MKKDNYRKILSEKFRVANQLETGPLTEEDEEYLRILAEARANHAKIKAARQEARKRLAARVAAVFIVAALVSSSYLLGMKSDTKASADPDDEVKVVQQGDNIIIGQGVSENDENVGVVTKTYYDIKSVPEEILEKANLLVSDEIQFNKLKYVKSNESVNITTYYRTREQGFTVAVSYNDSKIKRKYIFKETDFTFEFKGVTIYTSRQDQGVVYSLELENIVYIINLPKEEKLKIEALLVDLFKMD